MLLKLGLRYWLLNKLAKVFKIKEGTMMPSWLSWLLFPVTTYLVKKARIRYDIITRCLIIDGIEYPRIFLSSLKPYLPRAGKMDPFSISIIESTKESVTMKIARN